MADSPLQPVEVQIIHRNHTLSHQGFLFASLHGMMPGSYLDLADLAKSWEIPPWDGPWEAFWTFAAADPPPGIVPNFENPENQKSGKLPLLAFISAIITAFYGTKLWVQLKLVKKTRVEDWTLMAAWLFYMSAFTPTRIMVTNLPIGVHQWDMTVKKYYDHIHVSDNVLRLKPRKRSHLNAEPHFRYSTGDTSPLAS